jgi:hypothetical protein
VGGGGGAAGAAQGDCQGASGYHTVLSFAADSFDSEGSSSINKCAEAAHFAPFPTVKVTPCDSPELLQNIEKNDARTRTSHLENNVVMAIHPNGNRLEVHVIPYGFETEGAYPPLFVPMCAAKQNTIRARGQLTAFLVAAIALHQVRTFNFKTDGCDRYTSLDDLVKGAIAGLKTAPGAGELLKSLLAKQQLVRAQDRAPGCGLPRPEGANQRIHKGAPAPAGRLASAEKSP